MYKNQDVPKQPSQVREGCLSAMAYGALVQQALVVPWCNKPLQRVLMVTQVRTMPGSVLLVPLDGLPCTYRFACSTPANRRSA